MAVPPRNEFEINWNGHDNEADDQRQFGLRGVQSRIIPTEDRRGLHHANQSIFSRQRRDMSRLRRHQPMRDGERPRQHAMLVHAQRQLFTDAPGIPVDNTIGSIIGSSISCRHRGTIELLLLIVSAKNLAERAITLIIRGLRPGSAHLLIATSPLRIFTSA